MRYVGIKVQDIFSALHQFNQAINSASNTPHIAALRLEWKKLDRTIRDTLDVGGKAAVQAYGPGEKPNHEQAIQHRIYLTEVITRLRQVGKPVPEGLTELLKFIEAL